MKLSDYEGLLAVGVNVVVAVAGAMNAPAIASAATDVGVKAHDAVGVAVALVAAVTVFVGAVSDKLKKKAA